MEKVLIQRLMFSIGKQDLSKRADPMTRRFPKLRVVFEHISTSDAVNFVNGQNENVVASNPPAFAYNRNNLWPGNYALINIVLRY